MTYSMPYRVFLFFISMEGMIGLTILSLVALYVHFKVFSPMPCQTAATNCAVKRRAPANEDKDVSTKNQEETHSEIGPHERRINTFQSEYKRVKTSKGPVNVTISRSRDVCRRHFLTYHDVGTEHSTCFASLFAHLDDPLGICVYHIDAPGHHLSSMNDDDVLNENFAYPSVSELVDGVEEAMKILNTGPLIYVGVGLGARVLIELATRNTLQVRGLVLLSPTSNVAGTGERIISGLTNKLSFVLKARRDILSRLFLNMHFSPACIASLDDKSIESLQSVISTLPASTMLKLWTSFVDRAALDEFDMVMLHDLHVMLVVGLNNSPFCVGRPNFLSEFLSIRSRLDVRRTTAVQMSTCGSLACEERAEELAKQMDVFLSAFA